MKKGFTLVELLAVIVILAVILVIAVPQIMDTIEKSKKASIESSTKLVANELELKYNASLTAGESFLLSGSCISYGNLDIDEYDTCTYTITNGIATVTLVGKENGKFDGLKASGTKTSASLVTLPNSVSFESDSWSTIKQIIDSGKFSEYYSVGDEKQISVTSLGNFYVRISNITSCTSVQLSDNNFSKTSCGIVLEFVDTITNKIMNETGTNVGSWNDSKIRDYLNNDFYSLLPTELQNIIISTYVVSGHGNGDNNGTLTNNNYYSNDKIYLLSYHEIFSDDNYLDTAFNNTKQLEYYENTSSSNNSKAIRSNNLGYWLRSPISGTNVSFHIIKSSGEYGTSLSSSNKGIAPAFRIG